MSVTPYHRDDLVTLYHGDCIEVMRALPDSSVDAVVTDPPYGLEFMGKEWDSFAPQDRVNAARWNGRRESREGWQEDAAARSGKGGGGPSYGAKRHTFKRCTICGKRSFSGSPCVCPEPDWIVESPEGAPTQMLAFQSWCTEWATEALRVLKPGGHLLAAGSTRTYHRLACAVEDAGFEIRDAILWVYGQGFPKSSRVNRDERYCHCDASARTSSRTSPEPKTGDRTRTAATSASEGGASESAPNGSQTAQDSQAGCHPERDSGDAPPRQGPEDDRVSAPSQGDAPERSRSAERGDDLVDGSSRTPSPAPRSGHPSTKDSRHLSRSDSDGSAHTLASTSPADTSESAADTPGNSLDSSSSNYAIGFPRCATCGKPDASGWGTALKPATEIFVVARKPLIGTVAANVLAHGTGALNVDGCRVGYDKIQTAAGSTPGAWIGPVTANEYEQGTGREYREGGRWPANVILDESQARALDAMSGVLPPATSRTKRPDRGPFSTGEAALERDEVYTDTGGASRFFYTAKADSSERPRVRREGGSDNATTYGQMKVRECNVCGSRAKAAGGERDGKTWPTCGHEDWSWVEQQSTKEEWIAHPTVKPLDLMRYLVRLVTPPGGVVLEPFAGSGTTLEACIVEGFSCIGIEREADYIPLIMQRITKPIEVTLL